MFVWGIGAARVIEDLLTRTNQSYSVLIDDRNHYCFPRRINFYVKEAPIWVDPDCAIARCPYCLRDLAQEGYTVYIECDWKPNKRFLDELKRFTIGVTEVPRT